MNLERPTAQLKSKLPRHVIEALAESLEDIGERMSMERAVREEAASPGTEFPYPNPVSPALGERATAEDSVGIALVQSWAIAGHNMNIAENNLVVTARLLKHGSDLFPPWSVYRHTCEHGARAWDLLDPSLDAITRGRRGLVALRSGAEEARRKAGEDEKGPAKAASQACEELAQAAGFMDIRRDGPTDTSAVLKRMAGDQTWPSRGIAVYHVLSALTHADPYMHTRLMGVPPTSPSARAGTRASYVNDPIDTMARAGWGLFPLSLMLSVFYQAAQRQYEYYGWGSSGPLRTIADSISLVQYHVTAEA